MDDKERESAIDARLRGRSTSLEEMRRNAPAERERARRKRTEDRGRDVFGEDRKREDAGIVDAYGGTVMISIDGRLVKAIAEPMEIPCPVCDGDLPELRDVLAWTIKYIEESIRHTRPVFGPHNTLITEWPSYVREHECPRCGAKLKVVCASLSPEARELFMTSQSDGARR